MKNNQLELRLGEEEEDDNIEIVGHIGVDSGKIRIADPCYSHLYDSHALLESFNENGVSKGSLDVTIMTPCGDGFYPVFLDTKDKIIIIPLDDPYGIKEALSNTIASSKPKDNSLSNNELPDI